MLTVAIHTRFHCVLERVYFLSPERELTER